MSCNRRGGFGREDVKRWALNTIIVIGLIACAYLIGGVIYEITHFQQTEYMKSVDR